MQEIPFATGRKKDMPKNEIEQVQVPVASNPDTTVPDNSSLDKNQPIQPELTKESPADPELAKETPTDTKLSKDTPEQTELNKEMPSNIKKENCIEIDGKLYEIKPTKLKYFRNKMAAAHNVIKAIPLSEFLTYDKGVIDPEKDADQILYDYLVAAFDDPDFVHEHYEDMTADDVEKVINIFGRLNHIEEKEEKARKNREAQAPKR